MSDSYGNSSSSYYYSSSTSSTDGTTRSGHRYSASAQTNPEGTHVRTAHQDLGEPPEIEEHYYDRTGQERLPESGTSAGGVRRIADLDEESYGSGMAGREDV